MILSATFSKPTHNQIDAFGTVLSDCQKIRLNYNAQSEGYDAQCYTQTQCFTLHIRSEQAEAFLKTASTYFKNIDSRTESEQIVTLTNRHGKSRTIHHALKAEVKPLHQALEEHNRKKHYLLESDQALPFLVKLGVQTKEGKIIASQNDKFKQINRFLECLDDMLSSLQVENRPLRIADFGCGKSYLTFAVYWYLHVKKEIDVDIIGLDLKKDVIEHCNRFAKECGYEHLHFFVGNIEGFAYPQAPDLIITLHACDTATDFALQHAVSAQTKAILSVPCCQHEINIQLEKKAKCFKEESPFASLLQYGIIRERLSALATDALRAEYLTQNGYSVQLLEFIDEQLTPKNLMIRAVKKQLTNQKAQDDFKKIKEQSQKRQTALLSALGVNQTLFT